MKNEKLSEFKSVCKNYLLTLSVNSLRAYGRSVELRDPTKKKKGELIDEIIGAICGEIFPQRNGLGAPIKNNYVSPEIVEKMEELKTQYLYVNNFDGERKKTMNKMDCSKLKEVGTVRAIDDLGRVSVPIETRKLMGINTRELLEQKLYEDENGEIILVLRKYVK